MGEGQLLAAPHPKLPQTGLRALAPTSDGAVSDRPTPGTWAKATRKTSRVSHRFFCSGEPRRPRSERRKLHIRRQAITHTKWSPFHGIGRLRAACAPAKCAGGVNARFDT
jgi:hypothetical protein